jgi:hypothetical protein
LPAISAFSEQNGVFTRSAALRIKTEFYGRLM